MDAEGPPLGEAPVAADARSVDGDTITIGGPGNAQVLMFVSPTCHVCEQVMPSLGVAARAKSMDAIVLSDTDELETAHLFSNRRIDAPVVAGKDLAVKYGVPGTPFVVVLDDLGVVRAKGTVNNLEQLEGLLDTAIARRAEQRFA